jgi:hypothetical protein
MLNLGCSDSASEDLSAEAAGSGGSTTTATAATVPSAGKPGAPAAGSGMVAKPPSAGAIAAATSGGAGAAPQAGRAGSSVAGTSAAGAGMGGGGGSAGKSSAGAGGAASAGMGGDASSLEKFSFFVTSLAGLQRLAESDKGFGGDLRYGEADGLSGADKICSELAEASMPGAAAKGWHAFLSVAEGPDGGPVHAIDRVGEGPWYDRLGRVLAMNKAALLHPRPMGADPAIVDDLPNEEGVPNHQPDPSEEPVNNHHFLTGSDTSGKLYMNSATSTCGNWASTAQNSGRPRIGFSYPAGNRQHWLSGQDEGGCGAGYVLEDMGGSDPSNPIVGSGGGYGGFYCFALKP